MRIAHDNYHGHIFKTSVGNFSVVPFKLFKDGDWGVRWQSKMILSSLGFMDTTR